MVFFLKCSKLLGVHLYCIVHIFYNEYFISYCLGTANFPSRVLNDFIYCTTEGKYCTSILKFYYTIIYIFYINFNL